jgi:very-short-patch-repair endonuclease
MKFDQDEVAARVEKSLRSNLLCSVKYNVRMLSRICESPIEVALASAIIVSDALDPHVMMNDFIVSGVRELETYRDDLNLLIPQFPFEGYRIDIALRLPRYKFQYLFIECDGHDFHERTKEQAAHDRSRDRFMATAGIPVLRFTGSEIHKNAASCADQVISFINERHDDFNPEGW